MRKFLIFLLLVAALAVAYLALSERATLPLSAGFGPQPTLPAANATLIPTVSVAKAVGWREGQAPVAAPGFSVNAYADVLAHPRWLYVLRNGDVLVAETQAPPRPEDESGAMGWATKVVMQYGGAGGVSANRITLLRDTDGDGRAETRSTLLRDLHSPFGMAQVGDALYVANTDALLRFPYRDGDLEISAPGVKVVDLPAGPRNHHWTKNVLANRDGTRLYVTVGSNSNVAEHGMEVEFERAAILEVDPSSGQKRVFASGLRNPNGLAWQPQSGALWTTVNERDELGSDLVPDYMTSVVEGGFYGWPYSYFGQTVDARVEPQRLDLVAKALVPDYALGAHTASLGLVFYAGSLFPARYQGGAFIGQHGSWNRRPPSGYKVIFVPFQDGRPSGEPEDILSGFLSEDGVAHGRPVGVAVDKAGALLVADDAGNVVWRVVPAER